MISGFDARSDTAPLTLRPPVPSTLSTVHAFLHATLRPALKLSNEQPFELALQGVVAHARTALNLTALVSIP
ncbi:hypothetical protein I2I05_03020 [Hymenobacter sp. BT683]|uniref:Uncharacterized protein n=1 Tax=Hymenobacter jeongseonensis TaxID=2791027 RepID=A0ABS0IE61_9BACT|nr:hypothetical protein [Hymenobacter jeongseonensis]MBF9236359.1 hypothetical protein [Hymenobacter jeongseonensis]